MKSYRFIFKGLDCPNCAKKIENKIASMEEYKDVIVNFSTLTLSFKTNLEGNVEEILDLYFKQCSIEATAKDLAMFSAVIANDGVAPWNDEVLVSREVCRIVKTIMVTCGMYDASGEFAVHVGVPAKSGVGGGIIATVPRRFGIGIYGPALDDKGNSIGGIHILKDLSEELELSIF